MRKSKRMIAAVCVAILLLGLIAAGVGRWAFRSVALGEWLDRKEATYDALPVLDSLFTAERTVTDDTTLTGLQKFAWTKFIHLLPPEGSPRLPTWQNNWKTKSDLGLDRSFLLDEPLLTDAFGDLKASNAGATLPAPFRNSFRPVVQFRAPANTAGAQGLLVASEKSHYLPNFASVLFNREAANSVKKAISDLTSESENPPGMREFEAHSMMTKAIWTLIPMRDFVSTTKLSVTTVRSSDKPVTGEDSGGVDTAHIAPETKSGGTWLETEVDAHPGNSANIRPCDPKAATLSLSCLYGFVFDVTDEGMQNSVTRKIIDTALKDADNRAAVNRSCGRYQCAVILMGIHLMIHLGKFDPFYKEGAPNWVFITLWWNGVDNGHHLPAPWKYFDMDVTMADKENIVYSPYLEGVLPVSGTNPPKFGNASNCANCHRYASYTNDRSKSQIQTQNGSCLGLQAVGTSLATALENCNLNGGGSTPEERFANSYLANSITTHYVWSIAGLNSTAPQ